MSVARGGCVLLQWGVLVVSDDVGPGVVPAARVVGAARGVPVSEEPAAILVDSDINVVHGVVPVGEGPSIGVGGRGRYAVTLTRLSTESVAKKALDRWKVTAVTGRVWPALPKEAIVPVGVGPGVVLVGGVVGTVTDVPVDAGPDIAVPVDLGPCVVQADRETGTMRDVSVDVEFPVRREIDAGGAKFDREIGTEVDTMRGVPVVPVDSSVEGKY